MIDKPHLARRYEVMRDAAKLIIYAEMYGSTPAECKAALVALGKCGVLEPGEAEDLIAEFGLGA